MWGSVFISVSLYLFATFPSHLYLVCLSFYSSSSYLHSSPVACRLQYISVPPASSVLSPHFLQLPSLLIWKYSIDMKKNPSNFAEYRGLNVQRAKETGFTTQKFESFYSISINPRTLHVTQWVCATLYSGVWKWLEVFLPTALRRKEKYWRK